ncbi:MAG TPA: MerR family transcriptional regulator [Herpetosiphonaceae bacterium]
MIGEVARQTGLQPSALRYYEQIGLLAAPARASGRRRYDPSVVQWVRLIQLAKDAGCSMAEIQTLLHGFAPETAPAARWQALAQAKLREIDQQLNRLRRMQHILTRGMACGCLRLEDCVAALDDPAVLSCITGDGAEA